MRTALLSLLFAALAPYTAALAQMLCLPTEGLSEFLADTHGETPAWQGLALGGQLVMRYEDDDGKWTMVLSDPNGMSCVMVAGDYSQNLDRGDDDAGPDL